MKRDEEQWMKPERIQIWAQLIEGGRSVACGVWGLFKGIVRGLLWLVGFRSNN